jgi:hypothetical protein
VEREGGIVEWNLSGVNYIAEETYVPDVVGVLDCYISRYLDGFLHQYPDKLSGIGEDVRRGLGGDAGEFWRNNTSKLSGLGFIHLPNDELNGEPIIKNPWL